MSSSARQPAHYVQSYDGGATLDKQISQQKSEMTNTDLLQHAQTVS
jgi:hypothetical protein